MNSGMKIWKSFLLMMSGALIASSWWATVFFVIPNATPKNGVLGFMIIPIFVSLIVTGIFVTKIRDIMIEDHETTKRKA